MIAESVDAAMFPFGFHLAWGFTEKTFTTATNASRAKGAGPKAAGVECLIQPPSSRCVCCQTRCYG
jgi:hypothetical protein